MSNSPVENQDLTYPYRAGCGRARLQRPGISGDIKFTPKLWPEFSWAKFRMERLCHRSGQSRRQVSRQNRSLWFIGRWKRHYVHLYRLPLGRSARTGIVRSGRGPRKMAGRFGRKGTKAWPDRFGSWRERSGISNCLMQWRTKLRTDRSERCRNFCESVARYVTKPRRR